MYFHYLKQKADLGYLIDLRRHVLLKLSAQILKVFLKEDASCTRTQHHVVLEFFLLKIHKYAPEFLNYLVEDILQTNKFSIVK
jgi:hypothetical protein